MSVLRNNMQFLHTNENYLHIKRRIYMQKHWGGDGNVIPTFYFNRRLSSNSSPQFVHLNFQMLFSLTFSLHTSHTLDSR